MAPRQLRAFVKQIDYDLCTIRILLDYGRVKETLPLVNKILDQVDQFVGDSGADSPVQALFSDASWRRSFRSGKTWKEVRDLLRAAPRAPAELDEIGLQMNEYADFIARLDRWVHQNSLRLQLPILPSWPRSRWWIIVLGSAAVIALGLRVMGGALFSHSRGLGLRGEFFEGQSFEKRISSGINRIIDFSDPSQMSPKIAANSAFSARWNGVLNVPKDGDYALAVRVDDGIRLFIDGVLLIDEWVDHDASPLSKTLFLKKGPHRIRLEYFNHFGGMRLQLLWKYEGIFEEIIPTAYLRVDKE